MNDCPAAHPNAARARRRHVAGRRFWLLGLLGGAALSASGFGADQPKPAAADPSGAQAGKVLAHLNSAVAWYRQAQSGSEWQSQPTDGFYWSRQRALANEALQSAFASAQAEVAMMARPAAPGSPAGGTPNAQEARLSSRLATNTERLAQLQRQEAELDARIRAASDDARPALQAQRAVVAAQIDLGTALASSLEQASALFATAAGESDEASVSGQIAALRRSVPEAFETGPANAAKNPAATTAGAPVAAAPAAGGLLDRAATLFSLLRDERAMDRLLETTLALQTAANRLAQPLATGLAATLQAGEETGAQAGPATDVAAAAAERRKIETATTTLRSVSAALLPLRREALVLESVRDNLSAWRRSFTSQTDAIFRILLLLRAFAVLAALALVLAMSALWRRATLKYVHDPRRRRQFQLIQRVATGSLGGVVVILGFVSDFSSLATYAGFITAGIAVALQTVILSVAAYFFLIGRYGVRVGDRVTVSGVTGEVIDIGLVRVFLLELAGTGVDLHPTGRVVVLANSALFSTTPLYKQLPGADYAWHELGLTVAADGDAAVAQQRLLAAVQAVYAGYRPALEVQHRSVERLIDLTLDVPAPAAELRCSDAGVEAVVRYPVEIRRAAEIDGLVTQQVLGAIARDPDLKRAVAGSPRIRAAVKG